MSPLTEGRDEPVRSVNLREMTECGPNNFFTPPAQLCRGCLHLHSVRSLSAQNAPPAVAATTGMR